MSFGEVTLFLEILFWNESTDDRRQTTDDRRETTNDIFSFLVCRFSSVVSRLTPHAKKYDLRL
jgi:hypothetical protein